MVSVADISPKVPYFGEVDVWVNSKDQNVSKIIYAIEKNHDLDKRDYDSFSEKFWKGNAHDTGKLLFNFCKKYITYIIESEGDQTVKTPGVILHDRYGDCKHYALFITGVVDSLQRKGYPVHGNFRFVSDYPDKEVHHVFAVIQGKDGPEYWIDPVINRFDERPTFYNTKDVHMSISRLSGTINQDIAIVAGKHSRLEMFVNPFAGPHEIMKFLRSKGKQPGDFKDKHELSQFIYLHHPSGHAHARRNLRKKENLPGDSVHGSDIGKKKVRAEKKGHNNFLKKLGKGIEKDAQKAKSLTLKVSIGPARASYLSLVDINAFNLAHRLHDTLLGPKRGPLLAQWQKMGGNPKMLINATNNGYRQYKIHHGGYVITRDKISGRTCIVAGGLGVVQVAALMALASAVIAALGKFIDHSHEEKKQMAAAATEGTELLTKNAIQAEQIADTPGGNKALKDMTANAANAAVSMSTGVNAAGDPEIQVHDVSHPLINKAGLQVQPGPGADMADDVPGGGVVPQQPGALNQMSLTGIGNKIWNFIVEHKGPIIAITIGAVAIKYGPDLISKKKGRRK